MPELEVLRIGLRLTEYDGRIHFEDHDAYWLAGYPVK